MTKFEEIATRCGVYPGGPEPTMDALVAMIETLMARIDSIELRSFGIDSIELRSFGIDSIELRSFGSAPSSAPSSAPMLESNTCVWDAKAVGASIYRICRTHGPDCPNTPKEPVIWD